MRVSGPRNASPVVGPRRAKSAAPAGAFAPAQDAAPTRAAAPAAATAAVASVDALLALQAAPSGAQEAAERGAQMIDGLEALRLAALEGRSPKAAAAALRAAAGRMRPQSDPQDLNETLDAIDVRAAVELAKIERMDGRRGP